MKSQVVIIRTSGTGEMEKLGHILVYKGNKEVLNIKSLELPWRDNKKGVSCMPSGTYPLIFEYSNKFKMKLWEVKNVPNRSECKFHSANFVFQLNGCCATGLHYADLNDDNVLDVTDSRKALKMLHESLSGSTSAVLTIIDLPHLNIKM